MSVDDTREALDLDAIKARDRAAIPRMGKPDRDPLLRAEMDRRARVTEVERLREAIASSTVQDAAVTALADEWLTTAKAHPYQTIRIGGAHDALLAALGPVSGGLVSAVAGTLSDPSAIAAVVAQPSDDRAVAKHEQEVRADERERVYEEIVKYRNEREGARTPAYLNGLTQAADIARATTGGE